MRDTCKILAPNTNVEVLGSMVGAACSVDDNEHFEACVANNRTACADGCQWSEEHRVCEVATRVLEQCRDRLTAEGCDIAGACHWEVPLPLCKTDMCLTTAVTGRDEVVTTPEDECLGACTWRVHRGHCAVAPAAVEACIGKNRTACAAHCAVAPSAVETCLAKTQAACADGCEWSEERRV